MEQVPGRREAILERRQHGARRSALNAAAVRAAGREYKELWFALSRTSWQSLALVAGDSSGSANDIATSLANVGRLLHETVRTVMPVDTTTYLIAADLLQAIGSTRGTNETRAPKPF